MPKRKRGSSRAVRVVSLLVLPFAILIAIYGVTRYVRQRRGLAGDDALRSPDAPLPYVNYAPVRGRDRGKSGTTVYLEDRAFEGYNLYVPKPEAAALLVDMHGEAVHRWASTEEQVGGSTNVPGSWRGWHLVRMNAAGELLAAVNRRALLKLDWNSKLVWKAPVRAHHDVVFAPDGDVYSLFSEPALVEIGGTRRPIEGDGYAVLSASGEIKRKTTIYEIFQGDPALLKMLEDLAARKFRRIDAVGLDGILGQHDDDDEDVGFARKFFSQASNRERLKAVFATGKVPSGDDYEALVYLRSTPGSPCDVFHTNAVVPLRKHPAGLWKDGDVMISLRNQDLLFVIDPHDHDKVLWTWGPGEVFGQHQPSILPNGNILVFDNGLSARPGGRRRYSRVVEVDPVAKKIVWSYEGDPPESFYSAAEAGAQLLPNGNILALEERGRAFEVTRDKQIVWEYWNPKTDRAGRRRAGFYRFERIAPEVVEPLLARP